MANEESKRNANCEKDECTSLLTFKSAKKIETITPLPFSEVQLALSKNPLNENALEYLAGYYFKRLIDFHKTTCTPCSVYGKKIGQMSVQEKEYETYTFLKLYKNTNASLYQVTPHFKDFVKHIIQLATYCFEEKRDTCGIVEKVYRTLMTYFSNLPSFCKSLYPKFIKMVAKSIITNNIKWENSKIKAKKKTVFGKGKNSKTSRKLHNLAHT